MTTPAPAPAHDLRRRAVVRLGLLGVLLLAAGVLPWVSGGPLGVRLLALPLFAAGLLVAAVTYRVHRDPSALPAGTPARRVSSGSASSRPAGCEGCACGGCGAAETT